MVAASTWTEDRVKLLRELRDAGLSASQVGRRLGITRNAVIGKLARLGEKFGNGYDRQRIRHRIRARAAAKPKPPKPPAPPKPPKKPHISFNYSFERTPDALKRNGVIPVTPAPADMPPARALGADALDALQPNDCRWPIGDPRHPKFRFCGARCDRGEIYCLHHRVASVSRDQR